MSGGGGSEAAINDGMQSYSPTHGRIWRLLDCISLHISRSDFIPSMEDPADRNRRNNAGKRLKYAFDSGFITGTHPPDSPNTVDDDDRDSAVEVSYDSETSDSGDGSTPLADLSASFRVFSESFLRMELAEMERVKARETMRFEMERRRVESEAELTRMLSQTQLQIASIMKNPSRKRKRNKKDQHQPALSVGDGALLLSLLQCNFNF